MFNFTNITPYLRKNFGLDAGHSIMALLLSVVALTSPSLWINAFVAIGVGTFFILVAANRKQSFIKNIYFGALIAACIFASVGIVTTFFPGAIVPAILAGTLSYMIPKEVYDITSYTKNFNIHIDNISDAVSYQLLSWPVMFMLNYDYLAAGISSVIWFLLYLILIDWKLDGQPIN